MAVNDSLVKEIQQRDGQQVALTYLIDYEKMSHKEAFNYLLENLTKDIDNKFQVFEHYCMRDKQIWVGNAESLCPICSTDGVVEDELPDNSEIKLKVPFYTKIQLLKNWIMSKGTV